MKRAYVVSLIAVIVPLLLALLIAPPFRNDRESFVISLGLLLVVESIGIVLTGLILSISGKTDLSKSFFLAAAISMVVGTGVCSTLLV